VTLGLTPFPTDLSASLALAKEALSTRLAPGEELAEQFPPIASAIRSARATGGLVSSEGEVRGILLWGSAGPLGSSLRLIYLMPRNAEVEAYRAVLDLAKRVAGPIAFAPGPLSGLSEREEAAVMSERGFAPFGRSEMAFPKNAPLPETPLPPGAEVRAVLPSDALALARVHERAYRHHLDRYLALESLDPVRDAELQVREYLSGRFGELLTPGSILVSREGRSVAATIAVRRPTGALILDVMSEPELQGRGFGRAALVNALRALRERGVPSIVLNVTEGNDRAIRLYTGLGFRRTIGPSKEWYDARRMSVEIPRTVVGHSVEEDAGSAGR
jgi:ribosomal protein S18 acetylase RimI-like enzyme